MKYFAVVLSILLASCKDSFVTESRMQGIIVDNWELSKNGVSFDLVNQTNLDLRVESTWKLFIETLNADSTWSKVHFVPCVCGTPCKQPQALPLSTGESTPIQWDYISRRCVSGGNPTVENVEEKVQPGKYKMTFTLHPSKDGKRLESEILEVSFDVK